MDRDIEVQLHKRLRWDPMANTVPGSLPVLFFGDPFRARVATIGINPSDKEYLDAKGIELTGKARRLETIGSLEATDRSSITEGQAAQAIATMRGYFGPRK